MQFHPTAIDIGRDPAPLATEALRGEGARLINAAGEFFMAGYHPDAELAPRDVVARAIHAELAAGRGAFLDARAAVSRSLPRGVPAVYAACLSGGVDPRVQPIPVAPACHYHMGGIVTDANGATSLDLSPRVNAPSQAPIAWRPTPCWRPPSSGPAQARPLANSARPRPAPAPHPDPDLPAEALAALRIGMSRDAGVVRDAAGL